MNSAIRCLPFYAAFFVLWTNLAFAAPPASCARKFIGTWVYPGGTTVVAPGGIAYPKCPMCVPTQTWTCQGNTYLFSNSGPPGQFSATLSADGRQLIGGSTAATRVGGPARGGATASKEAAVQNTKGHGKKDAAPQQEPRQQARTASRQQANCSDITGTKSGGTSQVNCKPARGRTVAAAPAAALPAQKPVPPGRTSPPPQPVPNAAQQAALAGNIIEELGKVRSGQIPPQPRTGASADSRPEPEEFNLAKADPHRAEPPPPPPQDGQPCVTYFRNMLANFRRNAALCLRDTVLLRSLTDMVESDDSTDDDERSMSVTRNTAPQLFAHFDPIDPRWTVMPDTASPNCYLPLTVASQSESFMECARVYLCGMAAARCGLQQARRTKTDQCVPISRQCLARNPVPQYMTADPTPPPYKQPPPSAPLPNPPHRESTITGPSGPGGGGSSGGVMSAQ
jgi:hypothetical protein